MKLSRRQIRALIMEEINSFRSVRTRNSRQLNEVGVLGGIGILTAMGALSIAMVAGMESLERKLKLGHYADLERILNNDPVLKGLLDQVGQDVADGVSPAEAARRAAQKNADIAKRMAAIEDKVERDFLPQRFDQTGLYGVANEPTPSEMPGYEFDYDDI